MHKINTKPIFLYLFLTSLIVLPALAQTGQVLPKSTEGKPQKEEINEIKAQRIEEKEQIKEQKTEEKCENITERLELKVERYNTNREMYVGKYERLRLRIVAWAGRLEEDGYDVADLEAALATLDTKIDAVSTLHEEFITKLENIKNYECGNSDGAYTQALTASREALTAVRDGVTEVREYYKEEVKPLVISLRNQVAQDKETEETETD